MIKLFLEGGNAYSMSLIGLTLLASGEGVFHPPSITPLSLKLDYSNFVQNYFGIRSILCDKENPHQINNDVTMMSSFLC